MSDGICSKQTPLPLALLTVSVDTAISFSRRDGTLGLFLWLGRAGRFQPAGIDQNFDGDRQSPIFGRCKLLAIHFLIKLIDFIREQDQQQYLEPIEVEGYFLTVDWMDKRARYL